MVKPLASPRPDKPPVGESLTKGATKASLKGAALAMLAATALAVTGLPLRSQTPAPSTPALDNQTPPKPPTSVALADWAKAPRIKGEPNSAPAFTGAPNSPERVIACLNAAQVAEAAELKDYEDHQSKWKKGWTINGSVHYHKDDLDKKYGA